MIVFDMLVDHKLLWAGFAAQTGILSFMSLLANPTSIPQQNWLGLA